MKLIGSHQPTNRLACHIGHGESISYLKDSTVHSADEAFPLVLEPSPLANMAVPCEHANMRAWERACVGRESIHRGVRASVSVRVRVCVCACVLVCLPT